MEQTEFERQLVLNKKQERENVRIKQTLGMQGRDGGRCWDMIIDRQEY